MTKVCKSIAQFKLREGMPIGARTCQLRGDRMWSSLDWPSGRAPAYPRLPRPVAQAVRRTRQLTFGPTSSRCSTRSTRDRIDRVRGMDITVVTTATNDDEGRALLKAPGFPSREN